MRRTFLGSPWARTWRRILSPHPCPAAYRPLHPSPWFTLRIARCTAHKRQNLQVLYFFFTQFQRSRAIAEDDVTPKKDQHRPSRRNVLMEFLSLDGVIFTRSTERSPLDHSHHGATTTPHDYRLSIAVNNKLLLFFFLPSLLTSLYLSFPPTTRQRKKHVNTSSMLKIAGC